MVDVTWAPGWWARLPLPWRRWRVVVRVNEGDEVPPQLPFRGAVLVGPSEQPRWLAFDCPCGRGHRVMVNLDSRRNPQWQVLAQDPLTLAPSVDDAAAGRRCHFLLQRGRTMWVHQLRKTK